MAKVFISHSSADAAIAATLRGWLVDADHEVFLDGDLRDGIAIGDAWERRLHERLRWADAVVCVITAAYERSPWCSAEVGIARSRGSVLLPVRAEVGATHPLLTSLQWSDLADDAAPARLQEALRRVDRAGGRSWPDGRSPFPGLRPFDLDLRRAYFGRENAVAELAALLRSTAVRAALLVVGPSGCGKSSLVRAGLVPLMAEEPGWSVLSPIVPGADPTAALARELAAAARDVGLSWTPAQVRARLGRDGLADIADELLLAAPGRRRTTLLVVVDQLEELLTQTPADRRSAFAAMLDAAQVQVVATMRPEFLSGLLADPTLAGLAAHPYPLRPIRREHLRAVVEGPADLAGLRVSDQLVSRLVDDTGSGTALPLLAFTLAQLAAGAARGDELSITRYEELGGVQGALAQQADAALVAAMAAGGRRREDVVAGLLRLVTVDEQGRPTRWRVARSELPGAALAELEAFVARRLLVTDMDGEVPVVEVAHEEFLTAWPPLAETITARASGLRARRDVEFAGAAWVAGGRAPQKLWEGGQLAAALTATGADRPRPVVELGPTAAEFLRVSRRRDTFRRRRLVAVLSLLLVAALVGGAVAFVQGANARQQLATATARQLLTQADAVRLTDPRTALRLALAATKIDDDVESRSWLSSALGQTSFAGTLTGPGVEEDGVTSLAISPDGRTLAVCNCRSGLGIVLWDLAAPGGPLPIGEPLAPSGFLRQVAFSADGRRLLGAGPDSSIASWDITDRARPRLLGDVVMGDANVDSRLAFSPSANLLALSADGAAVQLWDLADPAVPRALGAPLGGQEGKVQALAFARDSRTLAVLSGSSTPLSLWDLADPAQPQLLARSAVDVSDDHDSAAFSADGRTLAVSGNKVGARLWDVTDRRNPRLVGPPLPGTTTDYVAFGPTSAGRLLTFVATRGDTHIWNVENLAAPRQLGDPYNALLGAKRELVAFSPDGRTMVRGGFGAPSVDLWMRGGRHQPTALGAPLVGHRGEVLTARFARDGSMLATGGADGTVVLWDMRDRAHPVQAGPPLAGEQHGIRALAFSPDGGMLAVGSAEVSIDSSSDGGVALWNIADPARPTRLGPPMTGLESDGSVALDFSADGTLLIIDATPPVLLDVRDPAAPRRVADLPGEQIVDLGITEDGRTLAVLLGAGATTADSRTRTGARLWDLTDPGAPRQIGPAVGGHASDVYHAAFSARGDLLVTADHEAARRSRATTFTWDFAAPEHPVQREVPIDPVIGYFDIALAPRGDLLVVGAEFGFAYLWSLDDPARPRELALPLVQERINDLTLSPDGTVLALAGAGGATTLWDLSPLRELRSHVTEQACAVSRGGLDRDEWGRYLPDRAYTDTCAAG